MADWTERYRVEDAMPCIDIRVRSVEQLFDNRDPAPFHERDLDDDAVDYLVGAIEEIPRSAGPVKVVVWVAEPLPPSLTVERVVEAIGRHFEHARWRMKRRIRDQVRQSRTFALLGLVALAALLTLAELTSGLREIPVAHVLPEGLTILAWVVLWRPLEVLVYDWYPLSQERRRLERMASAPIDVRAAPRR
ncbi:MAG: hypothetical protein U1F43_16325 [Myxococcota bacterium]